MQNEEGFQIATLVVVVITALAFMGFLLIFANPQVAINPLKPPIPTLTLVVAALPATWTPTPTFTPTDTPTPTDTSTATPTSTDTPLPSSTPTRTRVPFTRTPRPPTAVPWAYVPYVIESCHHSGGTYIEGYVTNAGGEESGTRVSYGSAPGGNVIQTIVTGGDRSPGYFTFVLNSGGARPGTFYVWISDYNGKPLSDPNAAVVTTNSLGAGDPNSCWQIKYRFNRQ